MLIETMELKLTDTILKGDPSLVLQCQPGQRHVLEVEIEVVEHVLDGPSQTGYTKANIVDWKLIPAIPYNQTMEPPLADASAFTTAIERLQSNAALAQVLQELSDENKQLRSALQRQEEVIARVTEALGVGHS